MQFKYEALNILLVTNELTLTSKKKIRFGTQEAKVFGFIS